jgi:hypothetical protein
MGFLICYCLCKSPPFVIFFSQINLIYTLSTCLIDVYFNIVLIYNYVFQVVFFPFSFTN